ncbi:MAG: hypothetical protein ACKVPX_08665 [Myxococcaceae bacterium]
MLSETAIQRFSRQVLLREVGGKGQERLLQQSVRLAGDSQVMRQAQAYLVAGGTPVVQVEADANFCVWPNVPSGAAPWVVVAGLKGASGILWRTERGCRDCFERTLRRGHAPRWRDATEDFQLGVLAALTWQRAVLGVGEPIGARILQGEGLDPFPLDRCRQHGSEAAVAAD